ncbi:MAG: hypothetical protein QOD45_193, partial [Pseudonocardiales bacterium]|nr:hypothetical protein [Pseudonocardiales bacterium]
MGLVRAYVLGRRTICELINGQSNFDGESTAGGFAQRGGAVISGGEPGYDLQAESGASAA